MLPLFVFLAVSWGTNSGPFFLSLRLASLRLGSMSSTRFHSAAKGCASRSIPFDLVRLLAWRHGQSLKVRTIVGWMLISNVRSTTKLSSRFNVSSDAAHITLSSNRILSVRWQQMWLRSALLRTTTHYGEAPLGTDRIMTNVMLPDGTRLLACELDDLNVGGPSSAHDLQTLLCERNTHSAVRIAIGHSRRIHGRRPGRQPA